MGSSLPPLLSGVVLCGGLSRRMGQDKASLPWPARRRFSGGAGQTLLGHVVAILRPLVSEVLVVARAGPEAGRAGQDLPVRSARPAPLADHSFVSQEASAAQRQMLIRQRCGARVVTDRIPGAGPLGGLEAGLAAMATPYGIVVACDMPWLDLRLLQAMADLSPGWDLVIPRLFGRYQPLHAVYAKRLQPVAADLLEAGECRVHALVGRVRARVVDEAFLRATDPSLRSTRSLDDRESYEEATALAIRS